MDERRGAVVGFDPVWGALLHNERAMAIFFGGGSTIIRLDSRGGGWMSLSLFVV